MSRFIDVLEARGEKDTKLRATLRRSLSFAPGVYVPAYPYVESFVKDAGLPWRREAHYLVAGLWAAHWREGLRGEVLSVGEACAAHQKNVAGSTSTERRFINLLDADTDQLPHRLRQMIALLKDQPIDFDALLNGLLYWNDDEKPTQKAWARDYYRSIDIEIPDEPVINEEVAQ
jgi:CRISPR system Cascade subunit CasB